MAYETTFPPLLAELLSHEFEYREDGGIDFEAYEGFQDAEENADWVKAWTGNQDLDASEYRFFGADGSGGLAGFWLVREDAELFDQPLVFFGSEGEVGMVACNFSDFCWMLADGLGPKEAVEYAEFGPPESNPEEPFVAFATKHFPDGKKTAAEVVAAAHAEFPTFTADIEKLCG